MNKNRQQQNRRIIRIVLIQGIVSLCGFFAMIQLRDSSPLQIENIYARWFFIITAFVIIFVALARYPKSNREIQQQEHKNKNRKNKPKALSEKERKQYLIIGVVLWCATLYFFPSIYDTALFRLASEQDFTTVQADVISVEARRKTKGVIDDIEYSLKYRYRDSVTWQEHTASAVHISQYRKEIDTIPQIKHLCIQYLTAHPSHSAVCGSDNIDSQVFMIIIAEVFSISLAMYYTRMGLKRVPASE